MFWSRFLIKLTLFGKGLLLFKDGSHELDEVWFFTIHQDADAVNAGGKPADKVGTDDQYQD